MHKLCLIYTLLAAGIHAGQLIYEKNLSADLAVADGNGNAYVASQGTVTKLNPDGSVGYSKALALSGTWAAIAVDSSGSVAIVGTTGADDLPTSPGVFQPKRNSSQICRTPDKNATIVPCPDAFVAKLDSSGNFLWASYLGGGAPEQANAVAVDSSGDIFVVGITQSSDFPGANGFQSALGGYADGFIAKIAPDGSKILYSSFMGGAGYDIAHAVAVDSAGYAYIAGEGQAGIPTTAGSIGGACPEGGARQAFLLKVAPAGGLVFGSCLYSGGATAVTVDTAGNIYLGGETGKDASTTPGAFDGRAGAPYTDFIAKISGDGTRLIYSSLFDGGSFGIYSMGVDSTGAVYAAGTTDSANMPVTGPALQPCAGPSYLDYKFLLKLNPAGSSLMYFSYEDALQHSISVAPGRDGSLVEAAGLVRRFSSLDGAGGPYLSPFCVLNGASFVSHLQYGQPGISPGELVTFKGVGLGPASGASFSVVDNAVATSLAGTKVLFDGVAAPIVYAQDTQVNAVAPYGLSTQTQTSIQIQSQDKTSPAITIPVSPVSPAVFKNFQTGLPLVLNQDFSPNSVDNPAAKGSAIVLFLTGAGQTSPPSTDGQVAQGPGGLQASTTAQIQNYSSSPLHLAISVLYAGPSPGLISAVEQINVQIPADLPSVFLSGVAAGNNLLIVSIGTQTITVPVVIH